MQNFFFFFFFSSTTVRCGLWLPVSIVVKFGEDACLTIYSSVINITGINFFLDFIHRHCVFSKPLRFEGWLFPHPQVKHTLLDPFNRASLYLWTYPLEVHT
jgi:hypothetical protein